MKTIEGEAYVRGAVLALGGAVMQTTIVRAFAVMSFGISAWCAGPPLTPAQMQAAIREGSRYKTADKVFDCLDLKRASCDSNLAGRRVQIESSWAAPPHSRWKIFASDGISKDATFFSDWQAVVAQAAAANQQMREFKPEDVDSKGLLHVFVEMQARGGTVEELVRYNERSHLVLKIGDRVVQPAEKVKNFRYGQSTEEFLVQHSGRQASAGGHPKITLAYTFDVSPEDLKLPVEVILIDGDGNRHEHEADLAGVLDIKTESHY
jgi:hypothetical protein